MGYFEHLMTFGEFVVKFMEEQRHQTYFAVKVINCSVTFAISKKWG